MSRGGTLARPSAASREGAGLPPRKAAAAPFRPVPGTPSAQGLQGRTDLGNEGVVGAVGLGQDLG